MDDMDVAMARYVLVLNVVFCDTVLHSVMSLILL